MPQNVAELSVSKILVGANKKRSHRAYPLTAVYIVSK